MSHNRVHCAHGGGDSSYADAFDVTGDIVLEQSEYTRDAGGQVLSMLSRQRFHNASGTGVLGDPSSGIGARVYYSGSFYDLGGRLIAAVDVGTNGGSAWSLPGSIPSSSSTEHVTLYGYAADAVQVATLSGSPTGGNFTLTFGGQTTGSIAYNDTAAAVEAALEALASVGSGNVAVIDAIGCGWEVRFSGTLAGQYQSVITGNGGGLSGGSSPDVAVSTLSAGGDVGRMAEVTDPAGRVHRTYSDPLGRTLRSIENFTDGVVTSDANKTVSYGYSAAGMTSLSAHLIGGGVQTTAWLFGVSQGSGSAIDSNNVVGVTQWPDKNNGAPINSEEEVTTINALGQTLTLTDRNGTTHELSYDVVGRLVSDEVTAFGTGVDQSVAKIEYAHDALGNTTLITSRDGMGGIVNQVQREFNGLGQLIAEWQEHNGAVTGGTRKVEYAWSEMPSGANHSRLVSITYPDGYVLTFNYASGINDDVSRLSHLSDTGGTLEEYDYLGSGTVVRRGHPQPAVDLTVIGSPGAGGDQYAGLDEFGRVVDLLWVKTSGPTALEHIQHSYDILGNRLTRDNLVNSAFDEVYAYDDLSQLVDFARGSDTQQWQFDALGNWESLTINGGTPEARTHDAQNQITSISSATTPAYDFNGNMTGDEVGRTFIYDAWNRLVEVKSGSTTLITYQYDGINRRITRDDGTDVTDLYYSNQWQVLEERVNGQTYARYVWSPVYVDAMVLRDRDSTGNGTLNERLYVIQDSNFNITALVAVNGTVAERYAYTPFGVRTVMDASWNVQGSSAFAFEHGFQGRPYDPISSTYNFRNREYSPILGRPFQIDPLGLQPDVNPYRWEGNGPTNMVDPNGTQPEKPTVVDAPDKTYTHFDQLIQFSRETYGQLAEPNLKRTMDNLRAIYAHPAVGEWIIHYANEDPGTEVFFALLRKNLNEQKDNGRRAVYIYLGHGSSTKDVPLLAITKLEQAVKPFDGEVKNRDPSGPIVIYPTCYNGQWYKLLPENMKLPGGSAVCKDGTIQTSDVYQSLSVDLVALKFILDDWRKSDPKISVKVYVVIGVSMQSPKLSKTEDYKVDSPFRKNYDSLLMQNWITSDKK